MILPENVIFLITFPLRGLAWPCLFLILFVFKAICKKTVYFSCFFLGIASRGDVQEQGRSNSFSDLGLLLSVLFFPYGDPLKRSMRSNGKNLRPQLLDDTSSQSQESRDLNSGLDPLLISSGKLPHVSVLVLSVVKRARISLSCLIGLL